MKQSIFRLTLLTLLGSTAPAALAQSPWSSSYSPWATAPSSYTNKVVMMQLTGPTSAWVLADQNTAASNSTSSTVYTSNNEGLSWNPTTLVYHQSGANGTELRDYSQIDGQIGWAVVVNLNSSNTATSVELKKTTTGAGGFATVPNPAGLDLLFVRAFSANVAVARVANTSVFLRTIDGGQTWAPVAPTPVAAANPMPQRTITLGSRLWIPTTTGDVHYTTDQGQTWATATTGLGPALQGITFRDAQHGLAYSNTQLARTTDGGQTWTSVVFSGPARTTSIVTIPGAPASYISVGAGANPCGGNSTMGTSVSTDDGLTWVELENTTSHSIVLASSPTRAWTNNHSLIAPICGLLEGISKYAGAPLAARSSAAQLVGLYPNPTTGSVQLPAADFYKYATVYDALGRQCLAQPLAQTTSTLNLASLGAGVYQVVLSGPTSRQTSRIVVLP